MEKERYIESCVAKLVAELGKGKEITKEEVKEVLGGVVIKPREEMYKDIIQAYKNYK